MMRRNLQERLQSVCKALTTPSLPLKFPEFVRRPKHRCSCGTSEPLHGAAAQDCEERHLRELCVDLDTWQVLLQCPYTGILWKKYYPNPRAQGGGAPDYLKIPKEIAQEEFDYIPGS